MVTGTMADAPKGNIAIQFYPKSFSGLADPSNDGHQQMITYLLEQ